MMNEALLQTKDAAQLLGCTEAALALWRKEGRGPAFLKLGRLVRYARRDLETYLDANRLNQRASAYK